MICEVCWDGPWTLSFGLSQSHGHGSWLVCEVALICVMKMLLCPHMSVFKGFFFNQSGRIRMRGFKTAEKYWAHTDFKIMALQVNGFWNFVSGYKSNFLILWPNSEPLYMFLDALPMQKI